MITVPAGPIFYTGDEVFSDLHGKGIVVKIEIDFMGLDDDCLVKWENGLTNWVKSTELSHS